MDRLAKLSLAVLVGGLSVSCKLPNEVQVEELTGSWVASKARFSNLANLNQTFDAIDDLGWQFTAEFESDGTFTRVLLEPDEDPDVLTGVITIENGRDFTVVNQNNEVSSGEIFLEGDQFSMFVEDDLTAEIDGTDLAVRLTLVMERVGT